MLTISVKIFQECNMTFEGQLVRHKFEPFTQIVKVKKAADSRIFESITFYIDCRINFNFSRFVIELMAYS